jgi:RimJ/RimL family protein N-acetyltransferase
VLVCASSRTRVRKGSVGDAPFLLRLLNDADFLRFIGDRGVRTLADAEAYARSRFDMPYATWGFGTYVVDLAATGEPIGIASLVKRDWLGGAVDVGYALLPEFRGRGLAAEATAALTVYARDVLELRPLVAIVQPDHRVSRALLVRLGFVFERLVRPPDEDLALELYRAPEAPSSKE